MTENNIPKHWQVKKLGEVCNTTSGGTPSRGNKGYYEGTIPWVKSGELDKGLILDTEEKISDEAIKNSSAKVFPKGTLLIALYGATIGKLAFLGVDAATNQAVCGIYKNENIDSDYLYHFLFSKKPSLIKQGIGGAQPNISQGILKNLDIPIPPLPEQLAIVSKIEELLSDLENGKQQLLTAQQQLKVYRQSLLKAAFDGKLTSTVISTSLNDPKTQSLSEAEAKQLSERGSSSEAETKEGELPKGWKWVKLGDICLNVEYGSSTKSKKEGKIPVLRMGNIQKGIFDWTDLVYSDDDIEINKYLLKKNDVLFNRTNSAELVGKTAIYKGERQAIFAGYLIRINRIESIIDANYLTYYLNTIAAKQYGNTIRSFGVNQSNINGTKLKTYPIPLPSILEQQQIVDELESKLTVCDKIEETIKEALLKSESLRQSILKKAFTGQLI